MKYAYETQYSQIERVDGSDAEAMLHRMLQLEIPGFVVQRAERDIRATVVATRIGEVLKEAGFDEDLDAIVDFDYRSARVLPERPVLSDIPAADGWDEVGVTSFHQDSTEAMSAISLNLTREGSVRYRLHRAAIDFDGIEQWDELDGVTGDILLSGRVDPTIMNPDGFMADVHAGEMFVFDTSYLHSGQTIQAPRYSEAIFYNRITSEEHRG